MPWYVNSLMAQAATPEPTIIPWYVHLLVAVGTLAVSFFLGAYLGKKFRMPEHGWKIGVCLFAFLASLTILLMGPKFKLGVDLRGGAILVYEVDQTKKVSGETVDMEKLIAAVSRRVNPGGQKEVVIRSYGKEQIEIIVPEKEDAEVQRIERIISRAGNLEFRILANDRHNKDVIERALADPSKTSIYDAAGELEAWWVPVREGDEGSFTSYPEIARRTRKHGQRDIMEILVLKDYYDVNGGYLSRADAGSDSKGQPCVNFTFNSAGGQLFGELTGNNLPDELTDFTYKLGIILDGELYSAPSIRSTIFDRGEITGSFTVEEVDELVNVLNAGSLPAALTKEPISKLFSGPTLGSDMIEKSKKAMIISAILVPLFMLWYYRFCGIVANIALALNMMMLVAIMLTFKAAFTLTGFAGLVLTIGMAVDNNVLVFERLREELDRGATLRMAIRNAFQRASATIIDANLTTLIAATVLYVIGTDQLKGFAVPLWLGVAISMFTSIFVARVIFDIAEKRKWITKVKMMRIVGHTNIDFMRLFPYCAMVSVLMITTAIVVTVYRGKGLFDIDFTGGVSVQVLFNEPQDTGEVRKALDDRPEDERLPDLAITSLHVGDEPEGTRFMINTSEQDQRMTKIKHELLQVFGDNLVRNKLEFSEPKAIEAVAKEEALPAKKNDEPEKKPVAPQTGDQSRHDLPPRTMLAMEGGDFMGSLLSQALMADATEEKPNTEKTVAEAQPAKKPDAKPVPRRPLPSETAKTDNETKQSPVVGPDPFEGGSLVHLTFGLALNHQAAEELMNQALESANLSPEAVPFQLLAPQYVEGSRSTYPEWTLKIMLTPEKAQALLASLQQEISESPHFPASSTIGGAVAGKTQLVAVYALVASWLCMIIYLWIRFQGVAFGLAAVASLIHDVFVILGAIAVSAYVADYLGFLMIDPFKINLPIVAAFLTVIGYSVNDTIVIFDRIREVRGKDPNITRSMINLSINQTLARTLLTSFTLLLVIVVLYVSGGDAVHGFAFALIVGVATGTFSSIYVASPILLWLVGKREKTPAGAKSQSLRDTNAPRKLT